MTRSGITAKIGGLEDWKTGRLEDWKIGRLEDGRSFLYDSPQNERSPARSTSQFSRFR
jgi:hypothetical protein